MKGTNDFEKNSIAKKQHIYFLRNYNSSKILVNTLNNNSICSLSKGCGPPTFNKCDLSTIKFTYMKTQCKNYVIGIVTSK